MRLDKAMDCSTQNTWKLHQNAVYWFNLKLAQEKIAVLPNKVACNRPPRHTQQLSASRRLMSCTKKKRLTPRVPRVVLNSNFQICLQDQRDWETGSSTMDCRIPGVFLSAVEQQDTHRKDKVKKLIEKLENHQNKESFLQDFMQTKEINEFSKKSQDLIDDMNQH